uniref:Ribonuclease H-like domain-containing protein n=1 Tax=Tanacetum cinerariifolium TaxID=118510 RepID=A0A6L2NXZ4_TANCI|nr:ribonuclease H-like domain-containing protein [Tanacetum cinerariifolium]
MPLLKKFALLMKSKINYEFGDSYKVPQEESGTGSASEGSAKKKGRTVAVTTEDMQKRRNDVKARTTILLAILDEHQLRFSKLQAIVSHLEFMDVPEWLMYTIVWRNKSDLDTISLDDLYNHLKVYEPEVQKKSESNSQNMAFISTAKNNSGKEEVNTASFLTTSTQVSPASANVAAASFSYDTNMALLSMRADRLWKKTGKKITIQGTDVAGFDKLKVECFNCHKMGHFTRECKAPRSQDKGRREHFKQGSKTEDQAPKALMAIDRVGWDWSYMANEEEDHALVADQEAPTEFTLMAKSSFDNEVFDNSLCFKACKKNTYSLNTKIIELSEKLSDTKTTLYHYKLGLSQVEARLVELKNQEIKFCEKIRGLEFNVECKNDRIEKLTKELKELKKEKEGLDNKLTGLPEFADDTITDYSRPSPSIETDSPTVIKTDKPETVRKSSVKYGNSQNVIDDKRYWDSGCSRHMTGNISYLSDYEPYNGGYMSFGQGGGKITGKGIIKTGKLEFENVYFVKDLKYNLFSVSQICDNKNSVLFTDSECIVLGRDFKLKDHTNVFLRTPRQHNMYFIDLNNIFPHKYLAWLERPLLMRVYCGIGG